VLFGRTHNVFHSLDYDFVFWGYVRSFEESGGSSRHAQLPSPDWIVDWTVSIGHHLSVSTPAVLAALIGLTE
jgi:hypothetical protein